MEKPPAEDEDLQKAIALSIVDAKITEDDTRGDTVSPSTVQNKTLAPIPKSADPLKPVMLRGNDPSLHRDQVRVINTLRGHARVLSDEARPRVVARLGEEPTLAVQYYFAYIAPIVIHFKPALLEKFIKDTSYRNLFEIGTGGGCTIKSVRADMETSRFMGLYDKTAAFERPKYGSINVLRNPRGNMLATAYGDCYLELRDHVRLRCTVVPNMHDTANPGAVIGVLDYLMHSIEHMKHLDIITRIATGVITHDATVVQGELNEVNIHGEVVFSRDVARVGIPAVHRKEYGKTARLFEQTHGVIVDWT